MSSTQRDLMLPSEPYKLGSPLNRAADEVIRIYRDNLEYLEEDVYNENEMETASAPQKTAVPDPPLGRQKQEELGENSLQFKISEDSDARVILRGNVTQEAIEKLIAFLNLGKDAYPRKNIAVQVDTSK